MAHLLVVLALQVRQMVHALRLQGVHLMLDAIVALPITTPAKVLVLRELTTAWGICEAWKKRVSLNLDYF
jgi:hypothetical protein